MMYKLRMHVVGPKGKVSSDLAINNKSASNARKL